MIKKRKAGKSRLFFSIRKDGRPFDFRRSPDKHLSKDIAIFVTGEHEPREKICRPARQVVIIGGIPVIRTALKSFAPSSRKKVSGP